VLPAVIAVVVLLLGVLPVSARPASILDDTAFRSDVQFGLDQLYRMDFIGAEQTFARVDERFPGHPAGPFLKALVPWWGILLDPENPVNDKKFLTAMEEVVKRSEQRLRRNPDDMDGLFFKAGAYAFRARVHAYRKDWMKAGNDGRRALSNLKRVHKRDPENDDLYFGLGLFNYLAEVAPRDYRFLRPVARLFVRGDRERGLAELERAASRGQFAQAEARHAQYQIYFLFEKDMNKALQSVGWLRRRYPTNALFAYEEGRIYAQMGLWPEASLLFQEVAERQVSGQPGYSGALAQKSLYWLARGEMATKRYQSALEYLDRLDHLAAERDYDAYFRAAGRLRRGMTYDALGRRDDAVRRYREVLAMGTGDDVRDRAREFLGKPFAG
jgi:tetratricopeptide (TPR) repeat protein